MKRSLVNFCQDGKGQLLISGLDVFLTGQKCPKNEEKGEKYETLSKHTMKKEKRIYLHVIHPLQFWVKNNHKNIDWFVWLYDFAIYGNEGHLMPLH